MFKLIPIQRSKIFPCARTRAPLISIFEDSKETSSDEEHRVTKPTLLAAIHVQQAPQKFNPAILIDNNFISPSALPRLLPLKLIHSGSI